MIVRDEAARIARCLDSARALVDDIVVLDTGSRDATAAIARAHGARVFSFTWCDDFAAARNAALDHSDADWNLVLDGDEWLEADASRDALASAFAPAFAGAPCIGLLPVSSSFDLGDRVESSVLWIPRLLPRGVRYTGRIHEQPDADLPRQRIALPVQHDGYRLEALERKHGRNDALLRRALLDAPGEPYLLYQLGKNDEVYGAFAPAVDHYLAALDACGPDAPYRHDLVVRTLYCLKQSGRHAQAMQLAEAEMARWNDSPDFYFVLGDVLLGWATCEPGRAGTLLPLVESCWQRCLKLGERPDLGGVTGRGSYLAAHNLVVLYENLGMRQQAERYRPLAIRS